MLTLRPATPADVATILGFIVELAIYEREPDAVLATEADLLRDGFSLAPDGLTPLTPPVPPRFACLLAELDGAPAGFALYHSNYSTWLGHHGLYLEDLFVSPAFRGQGIGKALLAAVAATAVQQGCPRLEWSVLHWNTPSIDFYRGMGAHPKSDWQGMRLDGESLKALAATQNF